MEQITVERSIWIPAPRERVWGAIIDPEQIAQWLLPPVLGAQMKRTDDGTLLVCMGPMEIPLATQEQVDRRARRPAAACPIGCWPRPIG
jgi:carbon monoxide dehydrogenase subunit G